MTVAARTSILALALAACTKPNPTCEKFVATVEKCDALDDLGSGDERAEGLKMMTSMCAEAFHNQPIGAGSAKQLVLEMYADMRARAECVAKAATCEDYKACKTTKSKSDEPAKK